MAALRRKDGVAAPTAGGDRLNNARVPVLCCGFVLLQNLILEETKATVLPARALYGHQERTNNDLRSHLTEERITKFPCKADFRYSLATYVQIRRRSETDKDTPRPFVNVLAAH